MTSVAAACCCASWLLFALRRRRWYWCWWCRCCCCSEPTSSAAVAAAASAIRSECALRSASTLRRAHPAKCRAALHTLSNILLTTCPTFPLQRCAECSNTSSRLVRAFCAVLSAGSGTERSRMGDAAYKGIDVMRNVATPTRVAAKSRSAWDSYSRGTMSRRAEPATAAVAVAARTIITSAPTAGERGSLVQSSHPIRLIASTRNPSGRSEALASGGEQEPRAGLLAAFGASALSSPPLASVAAAKMIL